MSEDYTYTAEPTRAQLAARVQELERENAELRAKVDAVPVKILREDYHKRFGTTELRWWPEWALPIGRWLFPEVQP